MATPRLPHGLPEASQRLPEHKSIKNHVRLGEKIDFWSKYAWTWHSEELYYCQSTFGADTEADALSAESANASELEAGCG